MDEAARTMTRIYKRDAALVITTLVLVVLLAFADFGNIVQGMQGIREIPYVVFIDEFGNHHPALRLPDQEITVPQGMIVMTLIRWVECTRTIPGDTKVLADCWDRCASSPPMRAGRSWSRSMSNNWSAGNSGGRVQITLPKVKILTGSRSYHVEWEETAVEPTGAKIVPRNPRAGRPRSAWPILAIRRTASAESAA